MQTSKLKQIRVKLTYVFGHHSCTTVQSTLRLSRAVILDSSSPKQTSVIKKIKSSNYTFGNTVARSLEISRINWKSYEVAFTENLEWEKVNSWKDNRKKDWERSEHKVNEWEETQSHFYKRWTAAGNLELSSKLQHVSSTSIQCFNLIHCIEFSEAFLNIGSLNNIGILENWPA